MPKPCRVVPCTRGEPLTPCGKRQVHHHAFVPLEDRKLPPGLNIPQAEAAFHASAMRRPSGCHAACANAVGRTGRRLERSHGLAVRRAMDERLAIHHGHKHFTCRVESNPLKLGEARNGFPFQAVGAAKKVQRTIVMSHYQRATVWRKVKELRAAREIKRARGLGSQVPKLRVAGRVAGRKVAFIRTRDRGGQPRALGGELVLYTSVTVSRTVRLPWSSLVA